MVIIFVDQITPRIEYTLDFIFTQRGLEYRLTEDIGEKNVHLSYSAKKVQGAWIGRVPLLSENGVSEQKLTNGLFQNEECFAFDGVVDPLASIFYHLTRYEEYLTHKKDEHGRFPMSESKIPDNWLEKTMCDRWAEEVLKFCGVNLKKSWGTTIIPTFDIDNAYAYKLKTGSRKVLSVLKDISKVDIFRIKERSSVQKGDKDPYDTYSLIRKINKRFSATRVFWLVGEKGMYDRNISIKNRDHRQLIRNMKSSGITIGLHPTYGSFNEGRTIAMEKSKLEVIVFEQVTNSRQHYLRFSLPRTYRILEKIGFKDEYSMGFAERVGFRCGTARAHLWFNLEKNKVSRLTVHPFAYMDGTLREYMNLSIDESKSKISDLYDEVKRYGGDFVFIWHNETIGDYGNWKGWSDVLNHSLNLEDEQS
ncbi:MAG: hypothetical protein ACI865_001974 [Flavobacteriaceae bacterium]|jgi:hypothetical protein